MAKTGPKAKTAEQRFWNKVTIFPGCWEWTASLNGHGYGQFVEVAEHGKEKNCSAHRFSWRLHHGEIPNDLQVLHRCDNPKCVNPAHLFLGTQCDNLEDMRSKGRHRRKQRQTLDFEQAEKIRTIRAETGKKYEEIAAMFGVQKAAIGQVIRGKVWVR